MAEKNRSANMDKFDCRNYIRPGDYVRVNSMKACFTMDQVQRHGTIKTDAYVLAVYEKFVLVKLKHITECINRWDIEAVNGKPIGNDIGYFVSLKRRTA